MNTSLIKDSIELKDITQVLDTQMTKEEDRKIIPKEVKNLKFILGNYSKITQYSWEKDGIKILQKQEPYFTREEKKILKYLLLKDLPSSLRPNVSNIIYILINNFSP